MLFSDIMGSIMIKVRLFKFTKFGVRFAPIIPATSAMLIASPFTSDFSFKL